MSDENRTGMSVENNEDSMDINFNEEFEVSTAIIGPPIVGIIMGE